jgi:hypothetical protein
MQPEFNAKAQSRQDATGFFYYETRNHRKDFMVSGLPDGIVFGRAFASLRLCVISFCKAGPGPDWPALPELGRAQPRL